MKNVRNIALLSKIPEFVQSISFRRGHALALVFFVINCALIFAVFLPNLSDINPWDEAAYVHSGMALVEDGDWPSLSGNPLTAFFFALTYLPFKSSPLWMVHSVSLARVILFTLLWLGAYLVAQELHELAPPLVSLGFLFVTPLSIEMLRFPSDPLFASLAALSLWQVLKFHHNPERRHSIYASIFMACAALARLDGLVLFIIFILIIAVLSLRTNHLWSSLASGLLPFLLILGGYILISGAITGNFELGISERAYQNFESGQQQIDEEIEGINPTIEARLEARRLFGTPKENQNSVFKAISRNPQAYLDRLSAAVKSLPEASLKAYGIRFSVVIFYFVLRGFLELVKRKKFALALILLLWPSHLVTGFVITLFRIGHLQFPYYVVFVVAAIGLSTTLSNLGSAVERRSVSLVMLGALAYGLLDNKLAIFYGASLTLLAIWTVIFLERRLKISKLSVMLILLCAGLVLRGGFPSPVLRTLGQDPKEQAVTFLIENYERDTFVGTGSPGVVLAARMKAANLTSTDVPTERSPEEFVDWMRGQGIELIYVDHDLYAFSPAIWNLIEAQIGISLNRVFTLEQGNYQVLELTD